MNLQLRVEGSLGYSTRHANWIHSSHARDHDDALTVRDDDAAATFDGDGECERCPHREPRLNRHDQFLRAVGIEYTAVDRIALIALPIEDPQLVLLLRRVIATQPRESQETSLVARVPDDVTLYADTRRISRRDPCAAQNETLPLQQCKALISRRFCR